MSKYEEKISDNSQWFTATPSTLTLTLPFYIIEAGHFHAENDYVVERTTHDSFLCLFTLKGVGTVVTENKSIELSPNNAIIIDCHKYHKYYSNNNDWEFIWIHFKGVCASSMFDILYPNEINAISMKNNFNFETTLFDIIHKTSKNDVLNSTAISSNIHIMLNILISSTLENEQKNQKRTLTNDIKSALDFIQSNYTESISIDDMIENIHISKYHFIRLFRRIMGVTPYNYLTNYRINMSKMLLRTTNKPIAEIAEKCGFMDTSNFITQFKKNTNQKPTQYRRDFS